MNKKNLDLVQEYQEEYEDLHKVYKCLSYIVDEDGDILVYDEIVFIKGQYSLNEYITKVKKYFRDYIMNGYGHIDIKSEDVDLSISLL